MRPEPEAKPPSIALSSALPQAVGSTDATAAVDAAAAIDFKKPRLSVIKIPSSIRDANIYFFINNSKLFKLFSKRRRTWPILTPNAQYIYCCNTRSYSWTSKYKKSNFLKTFSYLLLIKNKIYYLCFLACMVKNSLTEQNN